MRQSLRERVDRYNEQQTIKLEAKRVAELEAENIRKIQAKKRAEEAKEAARIAEYNHIKAENKRLLQKHQAKFKCRVQRCDIVSIPRYEVYEGVVPEYVWNTPVGLEKCHNCEKWACTRKENEHYLYGYCANCHNHRLRTERFPMSKQQKNVIARKTLIYGGISGSILAFILALIFIPMFSVIVGYIILGIICIPIGLFILYIIVEILT